MTTTLSATFSTKLGAAKFYAGLLWHVFPLHSIGPDGKCTCAKNGSCKPAKHPRTTRGHLDSTTDEEKIIQWWTNWAGANVGLRTGISSGLFVLDVDPAHGGAESLAELEKEFGPLPPTLEASTGGGGRHLFFRHPGGKVSNREGFKPGLDIRGDGGYVVAPPSNHSSGREYEWKSPPAVPFLLDAPVWLLSLLSAGRPNTSDAGRAKGKKKARGIAPEQVLKGVPEGQRDAALFRYAARLHHQGLTQAEAEILILQAAKNCTPPFPEVEAYAKVKSAWNYSDALPYEARPTGLVWLRRTKDGVIPVPLTNFTARIVGDVSKDDGAEVRMTFEMEATLGNYTSRFLISSAHFSGMNWAVEHLGAGAIVYPGFGTRDHARAAIQFLSTDISKRRIYEHTGWRQIAEVWAYLHGDGAIGPNGPLPDVEVELPPNLSPFVLPPPPDGAELWKSIEASLRMLDVAPDRVTVPVFAAVFRAVLGRADSSLHIVGGTGNGKSELAALDQQHFGPGFDRLHLPGAWSGTGNGLEALAFAAKDAILVVDDFAPAGGVMDMARSHRDADRVLRAQGNNAGRIRMRADTTLAVPKPPRGLIVSTGEDVPRGQSLQARVLALDLKKGELDFSRLTLCQQDARQGLYAQTLSGFIRWLAPQFQDLQSTMRSQIEELRMQAAQEGQHRRTPEIVANLALGLRYFLNFAQEAGALGDEAAQLLWERCWKALGAAAAPQADKQAENEPAGKFLNLVAALLSSGRAHLAATDGLEPDDPQAWGWRNIRVGVSDRLEPQGKRIGWVDDEDVYLEPNAAFAEAQRLAQESGEALGVSLPTLKKRLHEQGHLASIEVRGDQRLVIRKELDGQRRTVLHLKKGSIFPTDTAQPAQSVPEAPQGAERGPERGPETPTVLEIRPPETGPAEASEGTRPTSGPDGPEKCDEETGRAEDRANKRAQRRKPPGDGDASVDYE
jgi:hypothetical protein